MLCPICLGVIRRRDAATLLCGHVFCLTCITNYFALVPSHNKLCPCCKVNSHWHIIRLFPQLEETPAEFALRNANQELRQVVEALIALISAQLDPEIVQQMLFDVAEPYEAIQTVIEEGEQIANVDVVNEPDEDDLFVGNAVLIQQLNPNSTFSDIMRAMLPIGEIQVNFFTF
jgi:hypothetical protein